MSRRRLPFLLLAAALLLLAALFLFRGHREMGLVRPGDGFDTAGVGVVRLHMAHQAESVTLSRAGVRAEDSWVAEVVAYQTEAAANIGSDTAWDTTLAALGNALVKVEVDTVRLRRMLEQLMKLEARARVYTGRDTARLAQYGLDAGAAKRVEWTLADGRRFAILLGETPGAGSGPTHGWTYWKFADKSGQPGVYRTRESFMQTFSVQRDDWLKPEAVAPTADTPAAGNRGTLFRSVAGKGESRL